MTQRWVRAAEIRELLVLFLRILLLLALAVQCRWLAFVSVGLRGFFLGRLFRLEILGLHYRLDLFLLLIFLGLNGGRASAQVPLRKLEGVTRGLKSLFQRELVPRQVLG